MPALASPVCHRLRGQAEVTTPMKVAQFSLRSWQARKPEKGICFHWHYCTISTRFHLFKRVTDCGQAPGTDSNTFPGGRRAPQLRTVTATQKLFNLTLLTGFKATPLADLQDVSHKLEFFSSPAPLLYSFSPTLYLLRKLPPATTSTLVHALP